MKKRIFALIAALSFTLTSCSADKEVSDELKERFNSVVTVKNDAAIVSADNYNVSSGMIKSFLETFEHDMLCSAQNRVRRCYHIEGINNNGDILFSFKDYQKNKSEIGFYNIYGEAYRKIFESPDGLFIDNIPAFNEKFAVCQYSDLKADGQSRQFGNHELHLINTETGADTTVMDMNELGGKNIGNAVIAGNTLYFDSDNVVYGYDIASGERKVISENARKVMPYKGSAAYIKNEQSIAALIDGKEETVAGSDIFGKISGVYCSNDIFTYEYTLYNDPEIPDCATGDGVGFIKDGQRADIFEGTDIGDYFSDVDISKNGYLVCSAAYNDPVVPAFYDINKNSFVIVDDMPTNYKCFVNDKSALFISANKSSGSIFYYLVT